MRVSKISAVAGTGARLLGSASLNPRPGREGITRWKGWLAMASSGSVSGLTRCLKERFVKGKGGINSNGTACACGERTWMKCILTGEEARRGEGRAKAVRYWGSVSFRIPS